MYLCVSTDVLILPPPPPRFHPSLVLSETQVLNARTSHLPAALLDCVQDIVTAAGHGSVRSALGRLRLYLSTDRLAGQSRSCRKTLGALGWQSAIARYRSLPRCSGFAVSYGVCVCFSAGD